MFSDLKDSLCCCLQFDTYFYKHFHKKKSFSKSNQPNCRDVFGFSRHEWVIAFNWDGAIEELC